MKKLLLLVLVAAFIVPALSAQVTVSGRAMFGTYADFDDEAQTHLGTTGAPAGAYDARITATAKDDFNQVDVTIRSNNTRYVATSSGGGTTSATTLVYLDEAKITSDFAKLFGIKDFTLKLSGGYTDINGLGYSRIDPLDIARLYDRTGSGNSVYNGSTVILAKDATRANLGAYSLDVGIKELSARIAFQPGLLAYSDNTSTPLLVGLFGTVDTLKYEAFLVSKALELALNIDAAYTLSIDKDASLAFGVSLLADLSNSEQTKVTANGVETLRSSTILGAGVVKFALKGDLAMNIYAGVRGNNQTGGAINTVAAAFDITPLNIVTLKGQLILDTYDYTAYAGGIEPAESAKKDVVNTFTIGLEKAIGKVVFGAGYVMRGKNAISQSGNLTRDWITGGSGANFDSVSSVNGGSPYITLQYKF